MRATYPAPGSPAPAHGLLLRPWHPADAAALVDAHRDEAMRRWLTGPFDDVAAARGWIDAQERAADRGERFSFAVVEERNAPEDGTGADGAGALAAAGGPADAGDQTEPDDLADTGALAGQVVLRLPHPGALLGEVGYWTAARARGRRVAPRALEALTRWAFTSFDALTALELTHQESNHASCRVAERCGYTLARVLPPWPPRFPGPGHVHVRHREG
ncbi:GNAT family N-acetyltransferase [Streptomyces fragilis]|uniref:GNAT family N-acetyltransferase n=1 Tax=Streptomyces fragilis TaxID=67301 RepID=A0ABV2YNY1_9ACTN|nr:GNAT family N-acetyltransferase [Streptomyces fragilis]